MGPYCRDGLSEREDVKDAALDDDDDIDDGEYCCAK